MKKSILLGLFRLIVVWLAAESALAGEIKLTATSDGLSPATIAVKSSPTQPISSVP